MGRWRYGPDDETTTVDTTDIEFFLRATKDFTESFSTINLTVEGDIAEAEIRPPLLCWPMKLKSRALLTFTIPRTAITDAGAGDYEFTVTATLWPHVNPGSITLTLTVTEW